MSIRGLIQGASAGAVPATIPAQGVDFDGTYDYLSRATDLTGNVDSKTFTFSAWYYASNTSEPIFYPSYNGKFQVQHSNTSLRIDGYDSALTLVFTATTANGTLPINTWHHILVSIDLTSTANRYLFINDRLMTTTWSAYTNSLIDFTDIAGMYIGASNAGSLNPMKGRLSNVFLDYTYRDLSIEANRRIFTVDV